ncbi:MAG: Uma2 family endonuclease [Candidatus Contendobacter sp.]|nr:Uma2 family endonuclease [Candidatus Contendobacter sp.]
MNTAIQSQSANQLGLAEFIEWENQQETRHELLNGEIIAMTGGTVAHAGLIVALAARLFNHLRGTPYRVFTSDLKVQAAQNVFYPDIVVSCEPQENDGVLCRHPKLIIEVLSSSTSRKDRHQKRLAYQDIVSLEEYVLVSQEAKHIDVYRRADQWQPATYIGGVVELHSVNMALVIDELYADMD